MADNKAGDLASTKSWPSFEVALHRCIPARLRLQPLYYIAQSRFSQVVSSLIEYTEQIALMKGLGDKLIGGQGKPSCLASYVWVPDFTESSLSGPQSTAQEQQAMIVVPRQDDCLVTITLSFIPALSKDSPWSIWKAPFFTGHIYGTILRFAGPNTLGIHRRNTPTFNIVVKAR